MRRLGANCSATRRTKCCPNEPVPPVTTETMRVLIWSAVGAVVGFILSFLFTPVAAQGIAIVGTNPDFFEGGVVGGQLIGDRVSHLLLGFDLPLFDTGIDTPPEAGQPYRTTMNGMPAVDGTIEVLEPPHRLVMTWHVLYDNHYFGFMSAVTTRGLEMILPRPSAGEGGTFA